MRLDRVIEGWNAETEGMEVRQIQKKSKKSSNELSGNIIVLAGVQQKVFLMVSTCFGPCLNPNNK